MASDSETTPDTTAVSAIDFGLKSHEVIPPLALLAGIAATVSGNAPTGNALADYVLTALFVASVTWFAQFAKPQALVIGAAFALFSSGLAAPAVLFAAIAVVAALAITMWRRFNCESWAIVAALVGALTAQAVLYLPTIGFTGVPSLLAAVSVAPLLYTGYQKSPAGQQQGVRRALAVAALFAVVATVLAVVAALSVRSQVEQGIRQAEDGVTAIEQGDQPQALALLEAAESDFEQAATRLGGPLTWPARWVPIVAQHSRALETAADQGTALASTAARTVVQADVDKIRGQNGSLDLELVEAVNVELDLANRTLASARRSIQTVNSPWLLPLLSTRLDSVDGELASTAIDIDLATQGTAVLPDMLGASGLRRYIVLFVQPSEAREFGGFVGAYGLLEADQGRFVLTESGSIDVDMGSGLAEFTDPGAFPESYVRFQPNRLPQNLTATADLPTIAAALRDLTPQWRNNPSFQIDGVITIDPYAMAGMIELTGPLEIPGRADPITADNVVDFLLRDQYLEFDAADRDERQDVLRVLAGQAFGELLAIEIPGPERLGAIFGPVARSNRLSMVTFDEQENAFLDRIFLSADFPDVGSAVDVVGVFGQTGTASKLDGYSSRSTSYVVSIDPSTGQAVGELVIVESNNAPADAGTYVLGKPDVAAPDQGTLAFGSNIVGLGLYTRAEVELIQADTSFRVDDATPAFSYSRHPIIVEVPLGGTATVTAQVTFSVEPGRYDVYIPAQATAGASDFTLSVQPADGWRVDGADVAPDGNWTQTFELDEARGFSFVFEQTTGP